MIELSFLIVFPVILGIVLFFLPSNKLRWVCSLGGCVSLLGVSTNLLVSGNEGSFSLPLFTGLMFETTNFAVLYGFITCLMWTVSMIAAKEYFSVENRDLKFYYCSMFLALGGTLAVFYGQDFLSLFVGFELMSFSSYVWVLHGKGEKYQRASNIYLTYGTLGGLFMLLGMFFLAHEAGTLEISLLETVFRSALVEKRAEFACQLMFIGFGAKAGVFMLHDWMPSTYTEAPAPATALLSSILSKCGMYGIMIIMVKIMAHMDGFNKTVLCMSVISMILGGCLAFLSTNVKKILAYSSFAQMGFMLWGLPIMNLLQDHEVYAAYGFVFHMINHSFIKILLFILSGVMFIAVGSLELEDLKGFGKGKPWFQLLWTVGACSLGAVPLFAGYASKTLLHEAMVELIHYNTHLWIYSIYEWIFLISGGFTVGYMLKIYVCLFIEGEKDVKSGKVASPLLYSVLTVIAGFIVLFGLFPNQLFGWIGAYTADFFHVHTIDSVHYFAWVNLKGAVISMSIGVFLFFVDRSFAVDSDFSPYRIRLKGENTLRSLVLVPCLHGLTLIFGVFARIFDIMPEMILSTSNRGLMQNEKIPDTFFHGEDNRKRKKTIRFQLKQSLAYSLLMFGLGFIFTIVYLLIVGGTLHIDVLMMDFN